MVRAPTIRGRPTPARKHKTRITSSATVTAKTAIPKALKRAEKRACLLAKSSDAENKGERGLLKDGEYSISKSSLRRRKRKARDEIGKSVEQGREGGVREIREAVESLEMELQAGEDEDNAKIQQDSATALQSCKVTAKERRRLLSQEQMRQNAILSNPAYKASPFEALRMHARNTISASHH